MRNKIINLIKEEKIIAIIRGCDTASSLKVAEALYAGGIRLMEVTFNQSDPESFLSTASSIRQITASISETLICGAGTVLTKAQVEMAAEAGAKFIVSPNTDPEIISYTRELGLVSLPGAFTPSEIVAAHHAGADFVKLFPAGALDTDYIKSVKAPLSHIPLLAVGGVTEDNIQDFFAAGVDGVGVGGNLVNKSWIKNGDFDKITALAKVYRERCR